MRRLRKRRDLSYLRILPKTPLQPTAPAVTLAASAAALPPTVQLPRRPPQSLSLGALPLRTHTRT